MIRVPGHVTGFFKPIIRDDPTVSGSLGAGFSLKRYVYTRVKILDEPVIRVFFGGRDVTKEACTSYTAAKYLLDTVGKDVGVEIYHEFEIPIACGLASSGAGALGVVFAINDELKLGMSRNELAKIAHIAEVKCRTGLGSVIAQYEGMFEIRLKEGAPGIGKVARFPVRESVAILVFGPIETKKILSSKEALERVIRAFGNKHYELLENFSVENFCKLSKQFAIEAGLINDRLLLLLRKAGEYGLYGSMLMLGDGIFLFGDDLETKLQKLITSLDNTFRPKYIMFTEIDNVGVSKVD